MKEDLYLKMAGMVKKMKSQDHLITFMDDIYPVLLQEYGVATTHEFIRQREKGIRKSVS